MKPPKLLIQSLPSEMLQEIFKHCLPPDPMKHRQPDVTVAPMLLCHISSYWRTVALGMPLLWESLFCILRIYAVVPNRMLFRKGIYPGDLDFLRWWQHNLGHVPPRIRLVVQWMKQNPDWEAGETDDSLTRLVSSARHLDVDIDFACVLRTHLGNVFLDSISKTVLFFLREGSAGFRGLSRKFPEDLSFGPKLIPFSTKHPIRQMLLEAIQIRKRDVAAIGWPHLTHAILIDTVISTQAWFVMIRECVNLESAVFHIRGCNEPANDDPPTITLQRLSQLVVKWDPTNFAKSLFENLCLPGLTSLRLDSELTIQQLHALLRSTPSLQELHLCRCIPADPDQTKRRLLPSADSSIEPLSACVPRLEHLLLQLSFNWNDEHKDINHFLDVLSTTPWLELGRDRNLIKQVELTADDWQLRKILVESADMFRRVNGGVNIVTRKDNPWTWDRDLRLTYRDNCFDNLGFSGHESRSRQ